MAYDPEALTRLKHLKSLADKVKAGDDALSERIDSLESSTHSHSNQSVLNGITAELVEKWGKGEANVLEGVKVNDTALDIADKIVNLAITTGESNGTIKVNGAAVAVYGLKALAYKANVSEAELAAALAQKINGKADAADVTELTQKVTTLVGSDASKSVRAIAAEEMAKLIAENPDSSLDSIEEIAAWIQKHPKDAAAMNAAIKALQDKLVLGENGSSGEYATVKAYVEAAISAAVGTIDLSKYVEKKDGERLMTTAEGDKLAGIAVGATKVEKSNTNGNVKVNGTEVVVYTEPGDVIHGSIATDTEVADMLKEVFGAG